MADLKPKPLPFIPWETWQDKLGSSVFALAFAALFGRLAFWSTFDYSISRQDTTCRLNRWGYWQPEGFGGDTARIAANCVLPDGKEITLSQPLGWTPPDIGTEINIEIVNYRLSGTAYFVK